MEDRHRNWKLRGRVKQQSVAASKGSPGGSTRREMGRGLKAGVWGSPAPTPTPQPQGELETAAETHGRAGGGGGFSRSKEEMSFQVEEGQ